MAEIITKDDLAVMVIQRSKNGSITCLEAMADIIGELGIDPEDVKAYISESLRVKLEAEANRLNLLTNKSKTKRLF